ncbi:MAG: hypothetical protein HLX51_10965 [Micrococcaceae bacterium]|nr:hypothetical protein [Micrococcaceae bacterium]
MRRSFAWVAVGALVLTGCAQPREQSSVDVTPPPEVEIPAQTVYHQAMNSVLDEEAIISTGVPAIETLKSAAAELEQFSPEPTECAGTVDSEYYTTNDVAVGFLSRSGENTHSAQTVVAAGFDSAEDATSYFNARTSAWNNCPSVDLTIDDTNVLTLHYSAAAFADAEELDIPDSLTEADQDMVLNSTGELSGAFESEDVPVPDPGALPDYVISPDEVPEPEADVDNIAVTSSTVIARFDNEVFLITVEPGSDAADAAQTLTEITDAVREETS